MNQKWMRTAKLIGDDNIELLKTKKVAVFGIGGVGSFVIEALARCGIGELLICDDDTVEPSNINRQLVALHSTIGQYKADIMENRIKDINPEAKVNAFRNRLNLDNLPLYNLDDYDYIIDAIDDIPAKISLIEYANSKNLKLISAMGAGNRLHPERFEITDIYKTRNCPLCKRIRTELRKRNISSHKVVYSDEIAVKFTGTPVPASISFVPSVMGLMLAGEVIRELCNIK